MDKKAKYWPLEKYDSWFGEFSMQPPKDTVCYLTPVYATKIVVGPKAMEVLKKLEDFKNE